MLSDIFNYLTIQKFDISSMSNFLKHLFIYLSDVFGVSDIVNYLIIQQFDISIMSDVLIHLINYLSDIPVFLTLLTMQIFRYLTFPECLMF